MENLSQLRESRECKFSSLLPEVEQPGIARPIIQVGMFNVRIGAVEAYTKGQPIDQSPEVWIEWTQKSH